jgi:hypothetical protein
MLTSCPPVRAFLSLLLVSACLAVTAAAAGPLERRTLPADGTIVLRDYGYRDWPTALVHYTVPAGRLKSGPVCLTDDTGAPVPAQVNGDTLAFVASLPKGTTKRFTLTPGKPAVSSLRVTSVRSKVEVSNEFFTLRLLPVRKQIFKTPEIAAVVPGPLQTWQPAGGPWMGASRFVTARQFQSWETKILRSGPACFEYEARYRFVPQGEYVCRFTVVPGVDYAGVVEEYDFGVRTAGEDFLLLSLHGGSTPETIGWVAPAGDDGQRVTRSAYPAFIEANTKRNVNPPAPVGGQGDTPMPPRPEPGMVLLDKILPGGRWGGTKGGVELGGPMATPQSSPAYRVSVVPMHTGAWRRALALTAWYSPTAGLTVALPISTRKCTWYAEVTDDISPFSSHEHDPDLPVSYGRREWALNFNATPHTLQQTAGYIGLDRFKDWILDWPETTSAADYPRAMFTKAQVARLKRVMDQHPDRAGLAKYFVFSGRVDEAIAHAKQAIKGWATQPMTGNWRVSGLSHYRQTQFLAEYAPLSDDALACPELPADTRAELRRALAVSAYLHSDPDLNPRGAGVHLGNNNMSINRTCILPLCAGLLPDHPRYAYWMRQSADFVRYKLETYFTADGAAIEPVMYQLYGPLRFLADAVTVIHNTGGADLARPLLENGWHLANLSMPDPRYDGRRILPGMGNSGNALESFYGFLLTDAERLDPALAGQLQAIYRSAWPTEPLGSNYLNHMGMAFRYLPDVPASTQPLQSALFPTYGVTFRAHAGTARETAMLFRIGNNWGHWDTDALNVILYGQGAPLSPGTGYQYYYGPGMADNAIYHNQVKVGEYNLQEIFGRVDDELRDYGFGLHADYAVAARYYPPEVFSDTGGETWWNRHVLFLKSPQPAGPSYFVMRDTVAGATPRPTWWTWMTLEGADRISVDGHAFRKEDAPVNVKVPVDKLATRTGQTVEMATDFGASTWCWFADARTFRPRITINYPSQGALGLGNKFPKVPATETKTILEALGKPGEDFCYVVFPRSDGTAAPAVSKLADGVLKIVTAESTDYVFVSDRSLAFKGGDVEFTGKAGAVRVFADRVVLCMSSGSGKIGYKGCSVSGHGPFERVVALGNLLPGETAITGGYEKRWQTVDLGEGLTVRAEGPFTAALDGQSIRIRTDGRARQLFVTKPAWTDWVDYRLDGQGRMACWTDYPSSGWGRYKNTALIALTVPDGTHELTVSNLVYPAVWTRPFTPTLAGMGK